jgi:hypothetical protein
VSRDNAVAVDNNANCNRSGNIRSPEAVVGIDYGHNVAKTQIPKTVLVLYFLVKKGNVVVACGGTPRTNASIFRTQVEYYDPEDGGRKPRKCK